MNTKKWLVLIIFIAGTLVFSDTKSKISIYETLNSSSVSDDRKIEVIDNISSESEASELLKYYTEFRFNSYLSRSLLQKLASLGYLDKVEDIAIGYMKKAIKEAKDNPKYISSDSAKKVINIVNSVCVFHPVKKNLAKSRFTLPEKMVTDHLKKYMADDSDKERGAYLQKLIGDSKKNPKNLFRRYIYFLFLEYLENCHKSVLGRCLFKTHGIRRDAEFIFPNKTKNILVKRLVASPETFSETNALLLGTLTTPSYMARLNKSDISSLVKLLEKNLFFKPNEGEWKVPLLFVLRYSLHSEECSDEYKTVEFWKKNRDDFNILETATSTLKKSGNVYDIAYAAEQIKYQGGEEFFAGTLKTKNLRKLTWDRTEEDKDMPKYLKNALRSIFMQDKESVRYYNEKLAWLSKATGDKISDE